MQINLRVFPRCISTLFRIYRIKKRKKIIESTKFDSTEISYGKKSFCNIYIYISFKPRLTRPTKRFSFYSRNPGSSNPFSGGKRWPVSGLARENFQRTVCALLHVARIKLADVQLEFFTSAR